jgi:hypothetical protein
VHAGYGITIRGAAFYTEEYVRQHDNWLISRTGYRGVYEELEPRADTIQLTASWWGTDGRSSLPGSQVQRLRGRSRAAAARVHACAESATDGPV